MTDEPFGRQPKPVRVILVGEPADVTTYVTRLRGYIERSSYDVTSILQDGGGLSIFTIHPRAVND
jgi:hypothetical protein